MKPMIFFSCVECDHMLLQASLNLMSNITLIIELAIYGFENCDGLWVVQGRGACWKLFQLITLNCYEITCAPIYID